MNTLTNCAEKKAKQFLNLLQGYTKGIRITAILILLLMGVTTAWAQNNCDFLDPSKGGADVVYIKYSKNNASAVQQNIPNDGQSDIDLGTITSLKITEFRGLIKKHDGNVCAVRFHYGINSGRDGNKNNHIDASWSNEGYDNWTWDNWWAVEQYKNKDVNLDVAHNLSPGVYYLDFYFTIYGNNSGSTGCYDNQKYWSNNGGNYHIKFTIPSKKLTVASAGNGTVTGSVNNIKKGTAYSIKATANTGYSFEKWTKTSGGNSISIANVNSASTTVTFNDYANDGEVTASFTPITYNISYNNTHGVTHSNPATYTIESETITFTNPTTVRTGYTFASWTPASIAKGSTGNQTVTANWTANTYSVKFDANGGSGTMSNQNFTYGTAQNLTTNTFTRTGYTFVGWATSVNGSKVYDDKQSVNNLTTTNGATVTLYALWTANKYTVKFNGNGNTSGSMSNQSFTYDEAAKALTANAFSRTGYTFAGWNTNQDGSGTKYEDKASVQNLTTTNNATFNLYAQWTPNTYTVRLDRQGGEDGTSEITATYDAAMPSIVIPTRTGYTFGGYYTTKNGGGEKYYNADGTSYQNWTETNVTTLYAKWTETLHTVTIKSNDNTYGTVSHTSVSVGMHTASAKITATPKFGHVFKYWSATAGVTISDEYSTSTTIKATQPGTLTAVFAKGEPVSIYMRANHIWKRDNARYAVYYWHDSQSGWADMEEVGSCDETYYKAQIPFGYTDYLIARLDPSKKENNFGGPFWNKTANIVMPQDGKTFYNMRKIYFRPNGEWKNDNARFAAYFYLSDTENKWMSLLPSETEDGLYWCDFPSELYYDHVIFCRMNPDTETNDWNNMWNQTGNLDLDNNYFVTADKIADGGSWSMIGEKPGYDLTLYASSFGEYGYIHNNTRYYSPKSGSEIHKIPFENPTIKIFSNPYSDQYRGDVMYNVIGANDRSELQPGETLTFHCNTVLDDNYKTKGTHVVYLAVPNNSGSWISNPATKHHVYAFHSRTEEGKGESVFMGSEVGRAKIKLGKDEVEHIYFRCEVPAWCNTIRFEKRVNEQAGNNDLRTIDLKYEIPLNSINCYRLDRKEDANNNHSYAGIWEEAPGFNGDYRVICQRKEGNNVVEYASDIIRKGTTSQTISLHIYTVGADENYPKLILQKHDGTEWKAVSGQDKLVTDISKIMTDTKEGGCGVWNFVVTQDANGSNPQVNFTSPERYTGNYYIRTNNAEGQWRNYTLSTNQMTFSSYAKHNSGYSHYFCKWVDINMINEKESSKLPGHNNNVKFIIANDHGAAISAEMAEDAHTASGGILPQDANVRWTWNEKDNSVSRAYILGAYDPDKGGARNENIVVNYTTGAQKDTLEDKENWIYEIDLKDVQVNSLLQQLQATYPSENKTVYIDETTTKTVTPSTQIFASDLIMLDDEAGNNNTYTVRIIYDFKINKTLVMLLPDKNYESHIGIDVFIDRTDQGEATQVKATITRETPAEDPGYTVYGTMTFTQEHIMSLVKTEWERLYYWVSFPFDVRISDVFGFGEYGKHWIMEYYDGAERAKEGCWIDSPTYWRYITDTTYVAGKALEDTNGNPQNGVLVANRGYVLALARNIANMGLFKNNNEYVRLYFPSMNKITSIDENMQDVSVTLPAHRCDIQRDNRYIYDSHWNIIGVPSYANKNQTIAQDGFFYYYTYNTKDNTYTATSIGDIEFKSMHAYMVQHAGTIDWKAWHSASSTPELLAQRRTSQTPDHYSLRLELQRDGQYADQTFVQLHEDDATTEFDINKDLTKILNAGANIYTLTGEQQIQVAGNVLPITKTTIPVGVQVAQSGTYTFALPDGTDGISVTLVDNATGTHTDMLLNEYTVTLDAGTIENRFYLVVDPDRTATSVENVGSGANGDEAKGVEKFLIDGKLFIRTADGIFDAKGQRL